MIVFNELSRSEGLAQDPCEALSIDCFQACRNRFSVTLSNGIGAFVDLPDGAYLADGTFLLSRDHAAVQIKRMPEAAFTFALNGGTEEGHVELVFSLSHRLGNLHLPAEYVGSRIQGPLSVGRDALERVADSYAGRIDLRFDVRPLGLDHPLHGIRGGHR